MDGVSGLIHHIEEASTTIAAAVEEQAASTHEIARNVIQASQAAQDVAERIAVVSRETTTTGQRAESVSAIAARVTAAVAELRGTLVDAVRQAVG